MSARRLLALLAVLGAAAVAAWAFAAPHLIHDHDLRFISSVVVGVAIGRLLYLAWEAFR